jgi:hypothetical protein
MNKVIKKIAIEDYTLTDKELESYKETLREIKRISLTYFNDLLDKNKFGFDFANCTLRELHNFIKQSLRYVSDPKGIEHVTRAKLSLDLANTDKYYPLDCDDKSVLVISWLLLQNFLITGSIESPYKIYLVVAGRKNRPHHVYPRVSLPGVLDKYNIDSTYPKNELGTDLFPENFKEEYFLFSDIK